MIVALLAACLTGPTLLDGASYTVDAGERALELIPQGLVTVEEASTSEIRLRDVQSGRILKRWSIPRGGSLFWGRQSGPVVAIRGSGATDENQIATLRHLEKSQSWIRVPARALRGSTLTTLDHDGRTLSAWMGVRVQRLPGLPVPVTLAPPNATRASIVAIAVSPKTACVTLWLPDNAEAVPRFQTLVLVGGRWREINAGADHQFVPTSAVDSVVLGNRWPLWALQSENESLTRNDLFAAAAWENGRLMYAQGAAGELSLRAVAKYGSMIYVEEAGSNRLQLSGGRPRHRVGRINVQRPNQVEWWGDARPAFDQTLLVCAETAQSAVIERRSEGSAVRIRSMKEAPSPRRSQTR